MRFPLSHLFPLVGQFEDGEMVSCDHGQWDECTSVEHFEEFMQRVAAALARSGQSKVRIFKKPEGVNQIHANTRVQLCYVGEVRADRQSIEWTSHGPSMIQEEEQPAIPIGEEVEQMRVALSTTGEYLGRPWSWWRPSLAELFSPEYLEEFRPRPNAESKSSQ